MNVGATTPAPPYYAVIFTSLRTIQDDAGYAEMAARMEELAREQPGFLGIESARDADRVGITVSYWSSLEAIRSWGRQSEHRLAQQGGRDRWYEGFQLRVCRVEEAWGFERPGVANESPPHS
jgi:heme-degrading monooxygenase HmoA